VSALLIRDAIEADIAVIVAMLADDDKGRLREGESDQLDPGYATAFAAIKADPNQRLLVAEGDGAIVGSLQLTFIAGLSHRGAWRGQIEAVRIARDLRSQGLGREMILWAVERCRERGCRMVQLTTHKSRHRAHAFYERLGFEPSHVGMKLHLSGAGV
jgi:ribosomal protein S18 acetylase RimI-like enzyme